MILNIETSDTVNLVNKISINRYISTVVKLQSLSFIINVSNKGINPNIEITIRSAEICAFNIFVDMDNENI